MNWQPISTAPRDGTSILAAFSDTDMPHIIEWVDVEKGIRPEHHKSGKVGWHMAWDGYFWGNHEQPTHWMHLPDVEPIALLNGGNCDVPKNIAVCPECGSGLSAESNEWDEETGKPSKGGLLLICENYDENHRGYQSDWQIVHHHVEDWCGAVDV
jgi:hypothetical protein